MDKDHELDSDESDEDYCPDGAENEALSECDSDSSKSSDTEARERATNSNRKKRKSTKSSEAVQLTSKSEAEEHEAEIDEKEQKRHADALWSQFLCDTNDDEISRKSTKSQTKKEVHSTQVDSKKPEPKSTHTTTNTTDKVRVTQIFDFAGEKVEVTKEVNLEDTTKSSLASSSKISAATTSKIPQLKRPAVGGGLSVVLGQLNKKNKLNVLEKTKLDWDNFKDKEGLRDELKTYNKGKDGYLERQDFLERSDLRQFELERDIRKNRRQ